VLPFAFAWATYLTYHLRSACQISSREQKSALSEFD
jgi:hypothetical protein